ncbi:pyrroline-5-carboxylate reductase [Bifidobacterium pullorum]|uniref:pyrroline-5-carboxylate reductase n=1 Tax=Bifidobacterium pullorum TaxID=78448 RepID=UPI0024AD3D08|nr:pyrroline-5-carboxylate reductase [Bifidobacterium pullorum]
MPLQDVTVGFIGFGNMGQGVARGLVNGGVVGAGNIVAYDIDRDRLMRDTTQLGARAAASAEETVAESDVVVIAVKPNLVGEVMTPLADALDGKIVLSIAWGMWNDQLEAIIPGTSHLSVVPNLPIGVGSGVLVVEQSHTLEYEQMALVRSLFEPIALLETVDTAYMSVAGIVSSCAPAFTAVYIEALADAGVKYGLRRDTAYRLAAKMVEGTGAQIIEQGMTPAALKDGVCSPGGATIKGVVALEHEGFRGAAISAIEAVQG